MHDLYIVFEKDKGIVPAIIRYLTNSDINHVAIVFYSADWYCPMTFEATTKGVRVVPEGSRYWTHEYRINKEIAEDIKDRMTDHRALIGKKYDWLALFLYGWILIFWRWFKIKLKKPLLKAKDQLCSELVARVLWYHIKDLVPQDDPQWVTPQDLLKVCEENPVLFKKV